MPFEWNTFWTAVGAVATAVGVTAIAFAVRQLRFDAWLKAQEVFTAKEFVDARAAVFAHYDDPANPWPQVGGDAPLMLCRKMNELAHLMPSVGRSNAEEWADPIGKAWLLLEPTVRMEREKSNWQKKWTAFEDKGKAALKKHPAIVERRNAVLTRAAQVKAVLASST